MRFFSDNAAAAHPKVLEAIAAANRVDTAYDGDEWSGRLDGAFSQLFETEVRAFWVTTGTAANCLALAGLCPPYRAIICHRDAHIEVDEAGAPGFFTGGAKLILLDGEGAKVTPGAVDAACDSIRNDVHQIQPAAISITNATEYGLVYRAAEGRGAWCAVQGPRPCPAHGRGAAGECHREQRGKPGGHDLARRRRRAELRLCQKWRAQCGGVDRLPARAGRRDRRPSQARRISSRKAASSPRSCSRCSMAICGSTMPASPMSRRSDSLRLRATG